MTFKCRVIQINNCHQLKVNPNYTKLYINCFYFSKAQHVMMFHMCPNRNIATGRDLSQQRHRQRPIGAKAKAKACRNKGMGGHLS